MKTHHVPLIIQAIQWIFAKQKTPGKALELLFKTYEVNRYDKKIVAENVYEIIRWWRLLTEANNGNTKLQDENLARILGINLIRKGNKLPPHPWLTRLHAPAIEKKLAEADQRPAVHHSVPDWLEKAGSEQLGDQWSPLMEAMNEHYKTCIRVNTLLTTVEEVKNQLEEAGIECETSPLSADALIMSEHEDIFKHSLFKEGKIELQDAGSQHVGIFAGVKPGLRVIDTCAGAGGKTLHMAALMKNKGKIIAMDIHPYKLDELKKRGKRAGVENVEIKPIENTKVIKRLESGADVVLVDAPCSGLGVMKRNPDIKWKTHPAEVDEVVLLQEKILDQYQTMVKPGGSLVYVTCSILPAENEWQIKKFLEKHTQFTLEEEKNISPADVESDGFYMARLRKAR